MTRHPPFACHSERARAQRRAICLFAFSETRWFPLSMAMLVAVGGAMMSYNALNMTFLQSLTDDEMRGRVMSILTLTTFGLQPFGQLGLGTLASIFGSPAALGFGSVVCLAFAFWTLIRRPEIRELR